MEEETKVVEETKAETVTPQPAAAPEQPVAKPKSKKPIIIALIVLLVIAGAAVGGYFIYKKVRLSNPMSITTDLIDKMENSSKKLAKDKTFQTIVNTEPTNYKIKASVAGMASFEFGLGVDLKNDLLALSVNADSQGQSLLNMIGQVDKDGFAIVPSKDSKGAYTYKYDTKEIFEIARKYVNFINSYDSGKIFTYLKDSFTSNFSEKDFSKVDGGFSIELTPAKVEKVATSFVNKMKNDKEMVNGFLEFMNSIAPLIDEEELTAEDLNEAFDDMVDEFVSMAKEYKMVYAIGVDGFKVTYQIQLIDPDYDNTMYYTYVVDGDYEEISIVQKYEGNKETILKYSTSDKEVVIEAGEIAVNYNLKDEKIVAKYDGQEILSGTLKVDEAKGKISIVGKLTIQGATLDITITAENVAAKDLIKVDTDKYTTLDLTNSSNMNAFMTEMQSNPIFEMVQSMMGTMGYEEEDDWDSVDGYDDDDWDIDFDDEDL